MNEEEYKYEQGLRYKVAPLAKDAGEVRERHEANRIGWNQAAGYYEEHLTEAIEFILAGKSSLHPIERDNLGNLSDWCETAIHLQCASGRDTLSLWNEGVKRVVGVDISDAHIANARRMSKAVAAPATWYRRDVLDTPHELDGIADLLYTGRGALCWLQDLDAWAEVVYRLLKPGGVFHILEGHPVEWLFEADEETLVYSGLNYFTHAESNQGWEESYVGDLGMPVEQHAVKWDRLWPVSAVFQSLRRAGLSIEHFGEHPEDYFNSFPNLNQELQSRIPRTFSMMAKRSV